MRGIDQGVFGARQVIDIVTLDRLVQEWQAQPENQGDEEEYVSQSAARLAVDCGLHRTIGLRAAVTSSTRLVRVK